MKEELILKLDPFTFEDPTAPRNFGTPVEIHGLKFRLVWVNEPSVKILLQCEKANGRWSVDVTFQKKEKDARNPNPKAQFVTANLTNKNNEMKMGKLEEFFDGTDFDDVKVEIRNVIVQPDKDLDFSKKREDLGSDVVLIVEGKEFHVVKETLSNISPYFKTLFSTGPPSSTYIIPDIKVAAFQDLLEVIFLDFEITGEHLGNVLELSAHFQMDSVIEQCKIAVKKVGYGKLDAKKLVFLADKLDLPDLLKSTLEKLKTPQVVLNVLPDNVTDLKIGTLRQILQRVADIKFVPWGADKQGQEPDNVQNDFNYDDYVAFYGDEEEW